MAEITESEFSSSKQERAVVDTAPPFRSVKAAVSLFGERIDGQKVRIPEKNGTKEDELYHLKEKLADVKVQLRDAENAKVTALAELEDAKKQLKEKTRGLNCSCSTKQKETVEISTTSKMGELKLSNSSTDTMNQSSSTNAEEKHVVWADELRVAQAQHMSAVAELEIAKTELERLRQELATSLIEKESTLRQVEEALATAEMNAKRAEDLSNDMSGTNKSLVLVKLACVEASKERAALLAAKKTDTGSCSSSSTQDTPEVRDLKSKLAKRIEEVNMLHADLAVAKEREEKAAKVASDALSNLEQVKADLQDLQTKANAAESLSVSLDRELETATKELANALKDGAYLKTLLMELQGQSNAMKDELEGVRQREADAQAAIFNMSNELIIMKNKLLDAGVAEAKANEEILGLTQTLQQIVAEAEDAKESAKASNEEAQKARFDAEQAKAAMNVSELEVRETLNVAEASKAAEIIAHVKFNELLEKVNAVRASEVDGGADITISYEEYDALKKKAHEAEELANMRVRAANAQVNAVKAWESEIHQKLGSLHEDIDEMKHATKQALERAEMAEAAKSAVENEMRRWREKELQRREREAIARVQMDYLTMGMVGSNSQPLPFSPASRHSESLAQILNMQIPTSKEKENSAVDWTLAHSKKKKKHILPSLAAFLGKKSQTTTG